MNHVTRYHAGWRVQGAPPIINDRGLLRRCLRSVRPVRPVPADTRPGRADPLRAVARRARPTRARAAWTRSGGPGFGLRHRRLAIPTAARAGPLARRAARRRMSRRGVAPAG